MNSAEPRTYEDLYEIPMEELGRRVIDSFDRVTRELLALADDGPGRAERASDPGPRGRLDREVRPD